MRSTVKIFKDVDELSKHFSVELARLIAETKEDHFLTIALSGGSTPRSVFQYLAANFSDKIGWKRLLIFWSDERCVAPDDQESNYLMVKESLLDHIPVPASNIFRIKGECEPFAEADRYAEAVRQFVPSINNIPCFDLMMLGIGEDGHTVSIFPESLQLFNSEKIYLVAEHPKTKQRRITASGSLINNSNKVVFLVTGEAKSEIASMVLEQKEGSEKLPSTLVEPIHGEILWLLDVKAASKLYK